MSSKLKIVTQLNNPVSLLHVLVLGLCFGLGFLLRYYAYWAGESFHIFAINDEVSAFRVAMQFLAGEERAYYIGQPNFSDGHAPGPAWTLFWVALFKLGGGLVENALFYVALLNSFVVLLVYAFARQLVTPSYALLSCFLFAVSPWPVYYSTGLYNPVPLAFLGSLLFISLWRVTQVEKSYAIFWVCVLSALLPDFHMIGIFYYPAILLILYLSPAKLNRTWFTLGIIAALLIYVPYFIGEILHDWENTRLILSGKKEFSFSVIKVISGPVTILSNHPGRWLGDGLDGLFELGDKWFISKYILLGVNLISLLLSLAIVVAFARRFVNMLRQPRHLLEQHPVYAFVGILLFFPLLLFVFTGHNYSTRYAILIFPLLFILPALYLESGVTGRIRVFYRTSLPFMSIFGIYLLVAFFTHLSSQAEGDEYFINSFRSMELIRNKIEQHAGVNTRISIQVDEYTMQAPERLRIATIATADYVSIYENYIEPKKTAKEKRYIIRARKDAFANVATIAWEGNGIVIYSIK